MENVTALTSLFLMAYTELEDYRYVYFTFFILLYIVILFVNSILLLVIYSERGLHEPMYFFICTLSVNAVYGSTVIFPSMLFRLSSQNYEIFRSNCLLQIYCFHTFATVEFTILAVMAYDRYVAICYPLQYHLLMSPTKVKAGIALSWLFPSMYYALCFSATTVHIPICEKLLEKVYCSELPFQKLSCFNSDPESTASPLLLIISPGSQLLLILFSYAQILRIVCLSDSKASQIKGLQTCTPHIVTVINFSVGCLFELHSSHNLGNMSYKAQIFMSIYFVIIPPLLNPVIYGIRIQAVRVKIVKLFVGKDKVNDFYSR